MDLCLAAIKSVAGTASVAGDSFLSARQLPRCSRDDLKGNSEEHHDLITAPLANLARSATSRQTNEVYAGKDSADRESRRAREKPRGDRRANRSDRWFPASHLLQARNQSETT